MLLFLVIEVFDDSDKVGADVLLLHGCPQSCTPNPVEGLLEVYEDMVELLWVRPIELTVQDVKSIRRSGLGQVKTLVRPKELTVQDVKSIRRSVQQN